MGKIISEATGKLTKTIDKEIGAVIGDHISQDVDFILDILEEESYVYLGSDGDSDKADS